MSHANRDNELSELLLRKLDGRLSDEGFSRLEKILSDDPAKVRYYVEAIIINALLDRADTASQTLAPEDSLKWPTAELSGTGTTVSRPGQGEADDATLEIERYAQQALESFREQERRREEELAYRAYLARRRRLTIGFTALAAMLAIVIFTWLTPSPSPYLPPEPIAQPEPVEPPLVATLVMSQHAQWEARDLPMAAGARLRATQPLFLTQGLAQVAFDEGAEVILQAPCRFEFRDAGRMFINSGAASVQVRPEAIGFVIETSAGRITDHGTEFGVLVRPDGVTETHVYEGKVVLESTSVSSGAVDSVELTEGEAAGVNRRGDIEPKPFQANVVVREMPEEAGFAVPGLRLSLADVIGGGNGFGTGQLEYGIDPVTGQFNTGFSFDLTRLGSGKYARVPSLPFVDGVFVPDGDKQGSIQVSSLGHRFTSCPDTSNIYYYCVVNGGKVLNFGPRTYASMVLNGQVYGSLVHPAISMHSNLGVTFDLEAIRETLPGLRILRFESLCGISSEARPLGKASFWILVDGQIHFAQRSVRLIDGGVPVTVELQDTDRFLTLIVTDDGSMGDDYCLFAEPALALAPVMATDQ